MGKMPCLLANETAPFTPQPVAVRIGRNLYVGCCWASGWQSRTAARWSSRWGSDCSNCHSCWRSGSLDGVQSGWLRPTNETSGLGRCLLEGWPGRPGMSNPWLQGVDPLGELYHLVNIDRLLQVDLVQDPR